MLFRNFLKNIFSLCLLGGYFLQAGMSQDCWQLVWSDEFNGDVLDPNKWNYQTGTGCALGICGWGNNEWEYYRSENASIEDNMLVITAEKENFGGKAYTSARINTAFKGDFRFGRIEARIKLPEGQGIWPAFWMLPTDWVYGTWPNSGEIDITELIGSVPNKVHGTLHYGPPYTGGRGSTYVLPHENFSDDFHEFAIEWDEQGFTWYVDDEAYHQISRSQIRPWLPFLEKFHILLNLAVGGNWPGYPDASTVFPQKMYVDYVRVYKHPSKLAITGARNLPAQRQGVTYEIEEVPGFSYNWSLPEGANIVEGQGTHKILTNWGETSGDIVVDVLSDCGSFHVKTFVNVGECYIYCDFDDFYLSFLPFEGAQIGEIPNPFPDQSIELSQVGKTFKVPGAAIWAGLYADLPANLSLDKYPIFSLSVFSSKTGIVKLKLEDKNGTLPPKEVNASIARLNQWETLEFDFTGTATNAYNRIVLFFDFGHTAPDEFFFDNLKGAPYHNSTGRYEIPQGMIKVWPNPINNKFEVEIQTHQFQSRSWEFVMLDMKGNTVLHQMIKGHSTLSKIAFDAAHLSSGIYFLTVYRQKKLVAKIPVVKE